MSIVSFLRRNAAPIHEVFTFGWQTSVVTFFLLSVIEVFFPGFVWASLYWVAFLWGVIAVGVVNLLARTLLPLERRDDGRAAQHRWWFLVGGSVMAVLLLWPRFHSLGRAGTFIVCVSVLLVAGFLAVGLGPSRDRDSQ